MIEFFVRLANDLFKDKENKMNLYDKLIHLVDYLTTKTTFL